MEIALLPEPKVANGTKKSPNAFDEAAKQDKLEDNDVTPDMEGNKEVVLTQYHLILFQGPGADINRLVFRDIQRELDDIVVTPSSETAIDVWLESPGGDAHSAYKIFLELRSRCSRLRVVVPDYAKSAATLFSLGADTVFMGASAELGPLDVQIEHPDREGETVSGLDVADSLEYLAQTAMGLVIAGGAGIVKYTRLSRHDVLQETLRFMAKFLQPTIAKLDPHLLHRASQQLQVAERYALTMLQERNLSEEHHLRSDEAHALIRRLVYGYPAHGYVICRDEAKHLGLPVEPAEEYPRWDAVQYAYRKFEEGDTSVISVILDADLDASSISTSNTGG